MREVRVVALPRRAADTHVRGSGAGGSSSSDGDGGSSGVHGTLPEDGRQLRGVLVFGLGDRLADMAHMLRTELGFLRDAHVECYSPPDGKTVQLSTLPQCLEVTQASLRMRKKETGRREGENGGLRREGYNWGLRREGCNWGLRREGYNWGLELWKGVGTISPARRGDGGGRVNRGPSFHSFLLARHHWARPLHALSLQPPSELNLRPAGPHLSVGDFAPASRRLRAPRERSDPRGLCRLDWNYRHRRDPPRDGVTLLGGGAGGKGGRLSGAPCARGRRTTISWRSISPARCRAVRAGLPGGVGDVRMCASMADRDWPVVAVSRV
eukprot:scaffold7792_cov118-Isochrysis_galbana.AAC.2